MSFTSSYFCPYFCPHLCPNSDAPSEHTHTYIYKSTQTHTYKPISSAHRLDTLWWRCAAWPRTCPVVL
jgi:hypothetical protein